MNVPYTGDVRVAAWKHACGRGGAAHRSRVLSSGRGEAMKVGLFFEIQVPKPWRPGDERSAFMHALAQAEAADIAGFDTIWCVEHHFLEEYSHLSAPEIFLAACSQRTERIRLGHGIMHVVPQINHPVRIAERLSTLDVLSNGRVEFGAGESSSIPELAGFGIAPCDKRNAAREGLEAVVRCMTETPFAGMQGRFVDVPPRNVVPKPVQVPHPPIWMACSKRERIIEAAELGVGALAFAFLSPDEARAWVRAYEHALLQSCRPIGAVVNPRVACTIPAFVHEDAAEAQRRGERGARFWQYSLDHYYSGRARHTPGETSLGPTFMAAERDRTSTHRSTAGIFGTPAEAIATLRGFEAAGVDEIILVVSAGDTEHAHVLECIALIGREVLPGIRARHADTLRAKAERLAGLAPVHARPLLPAAASADELSASDTRTFMDLLAQRASSARR